MHQQIHLHLHAFLTQLTRVIMLQEHWFQEAGLVVLLLSHCWGESNWTKYDRVFMSYFLTVDSIESCQDTDVMGFSWQCGCISLPSCVLVGVGVTGASVLLWYWHVVSRRLLWWRVARLVQCCRRQVYVRSRLRGACAFPRWPSQSLFILAVVFPSCIFQYSLNLLVSFSSFLCPYFITVLPLLLSRFQCPLPVPPQARWTHHPEGFVGRQRGVLLH